jgi:glycosyltransferase involved in cell wall biosynthesis
MKILIPFIKKVVKNADIVAGISSETVNVIKKITGQNAHIIPDGIDTNYYKPDNKNEEILNKYNAKNKFVIFFTGRMVERKGHIFLLEAFNKLYKTNKQVHLILGGKGLMEDVIRTKCKEYNLNNAVSFPGFIPESEIVPLLQSSDVYVLPSCIDKYGDTEGSATAALEAMACGTPAIISKVGGNINAVENKNGAFYFEPENINELSEILNQVISSKDYNLQQKKAREYIINNYSWDKIINKYLKLM